MKMPADPILTPDERAWRLKLYGLIMLFGLPYCLWVASDYSERLSPVAGLTIFVGYLAFVYGIVLILWRRRHRNKLGDEKSDD